MARSSLCPDSPPDLPDDLTEPTSAYKTQTVMVLFALALFFLLYFGVLLTTAFYVLWAIFLSPQNVRVLALIMALPSGILFVFMLKNLFKFERARKDFLIEIFEDEHPKLFQFIEQVCDETGAPFPKHVYVDYKVNAAAIPDTTSFFHLFVPTGSSLLIGLGLVNAVNLTEFKAMLAHEFGHFSQKGMKIGTYVYTVRRILVQVVYGEDIFDRFIVHWSHLDPRISFPAWIIRGILWVLRRILRLMWEAVDFLDLALSRQMEFNADLVAVSVAGSDAPVHLLYRCCFADACFNQAVNDLRVAMDHHVYTSDLYYHQSASARYLRLHKKDPMLGEPPALPRDARRLTQVFDEDDDKMAEMWQTHPSSYDREQNAKSHYIRTEFDERSPWLLFENVEELRERVTYKFYRFFFRIPKDVILADPEEVQGFIDEEHADRSYDPKYQGLYDNRNILLKNLSDQAKEGSQQPWSITQLAQAHATLYDAEVKHRAQLYYKHNEEMLYLNAVMNGWQRLKDDELDFRGEIYDPQKAKSLLKKVDKDLKNDHAWLEEIDQKVFMTYFQMALHINQAVADELFRRYTFHMEMQNIWYELQNHQRPIQNALGFLNSIASNSASTNLTPADFEDLLKIFRDAHKAMKRMLLRAEDLALPGMKSLPAGQPLRGYLLGKPLIDGLSEYEQRIRNNWIDKLLQQFNEMKGKVDRIHFKSLAAILALQEKIGAECMERWARLPAVKPAST